MSRQTREYAKKLVAQMTIEEKMSQMLYESPAIERLHIPAYNWWNEALHGVARAGVATVFPQAIGLAATFDPKLIEKIGDVVSTEGRAKFNEFSRKGDHGIYKGLTFWAPNVNIFRDPRWGRGHETYGEDPYLTGELGCAYIRGLQGEDPEHLKSAACAKHFAVHSGPEAIRHEFDARVSKHDLYDTYLYAFKRCVKDAKVEAVMGAYNRVNGEPACGSKTLLQDILRDEFGFEGHVVSDCWAILDFHEHHHVTNTVEESAAMAVNNGCDLNCGSAFLHLQDAYDQGLISEEKITSAVERLMEVRIRLGMMEDYPSPYENLSYDQVESKEHVALSVEAARRSLVLLKNENQFLPLDKNKINTIAVIGPNANSRDALVGNYFGTSSRYITPLEGIQQYVGDDVRVLYAEGCHLYKDKVQFLANPKDRFQEAVIAAEKADVVVLSFVTSTLTFTVSLTLHCVRDTVKVSVDVTNESTYTVYESVQAYIRHEDAAAYEPGYQLKGIETITLKPGETKHVELTLKVRDFAIITEKGDCVVRPGSYRIALDGQQPDVRSEELMGQRVQTIEIQRVGAETPVEY